MTDKQKIEYPYCKNCTWYNYSCHKNGNTVYELKYLTCDIPFEECPYDKKCSQECLEYRELIYKDIEIGYELGDKGRCVKNYDR